jgi:hypothetical protein
MLEMFERFNIVDEEVFVIHRGDFDVESAKQKKVTTKRAVFLILNVLYRRCWTPLWTMITLMRFN